MSPQTTRQLEGVLGGRLTQQNVGGRGGVTVRANFTGMGIGPGLSNGSAISRGSWRGC